MKPIDIETVRKISRVLIPKALYRFISIFVNMLVVISAEGLVVWLKLSFQKKDSFKIKLRCCQLPVQLRNTPNDKNGIIRMEYGQYKLDFQPNIVIDAGCFIGDVSLYFLNKYPKCQLITLEPNKENFEIASVNLKPYNDRAILLNKGLWYEETTLYVKGCSVSSKITSELQTGQGSEKVECITIPSIIEKYNIEYIDILKMDIEGAEKEIFSEDITSWITKTKLILIEIHSQEIEELCYRVFKKYGFYGYKYRTVHYLYNSVLLNSKGIS
jgi:FkbM family methyltransferase